MIVVNVGELKKKVHLIDETNVKFFDSLIKANGKLQPLYEQDYVDFLTDIGVLFSANLQE